MAKTSDGIQLGTPLRGKRGAGRSGRGRQCDQDGCTTVLSTYNSSTTCWTHATPTYSRPLARP